MPQAAMMLLKIALMMSIITGLFVGLIVILGISSQYLFSGINQNVLQDIFSLVQVWLPFNLDIIIVWIFLAGFAYISYRIVAMTYSSISKAIQ